MVFVLSGCSNPGATTCDEYSALSSNEALQLEQDLLRANDLEPNNIGNSTGLRQQVASYCGIPGTGMGFPATRNNSASIEDAVDWDSATW